MTLPSRPVTVKVTCMGKASRKKRQAQERSGVVTPKAAPAPYIVRPFAGLPGEPDWVAMREIVPSATATVTLREDVAGLPEGAPREVTICTVLPMAWPALRRHDGQVLVALQTVQSTGDASRDVAQALLAAVAAEPGTPVDVLPPATADTPRLQDILDTTAPFAVEVHEDFGFWVSSQSELDEQGRAAIEEANAAVVPTTRIDGVDSAYWCRVGERTHIRWILSQDEDQATDALARLHAAGTDTLGERTRLLGAFRADGLLCPVWELDPSKGAEEYVAPMAQTAAAFADALNGAPLTAEERRARNGLLSRQITLR